MSRSAGGRGRLATELRGTSNLDSGVTFSGTEIHQNGVRWVRSATTATISLYNQAIKVESGGGSTDGVVVYIPTASVEANTTYVMEFDIVEKSAGITYFNCQAHTPGDDVYRVITRKTGTGHHAILFTTQAVLPAYIRLRITGNVVSTGNYFVVDNFICKKYTAVTQTRELGTDFNTAVMSGVNVSSDGLLWTPLNSSITSFSVVGTTDKKLKVTCTSVDEAWLKMEAALTGGRNYILRFAMTQDTVTKRLGLRLYARTGSTWAVTETQGLIYTGNGHYLVNFTHPAGADAIRVEFLRSNSGQTYDGYNTPYTIDDFSISRLDTASTRTVTVCDPPVGGEEKALHRYGFNGQERSMEINGDGNGYTAEFWEYDARLGRRWNLDPKPITGVSEYSAFNNNPILHVDIQGDTSERPSWGQKGWVNLSQYSLSSMKPEGNALNKAGAHVHNLILAPLINLGLNTADVITNPGWTIYNIGAGIGNGFSSLGEWFKNNPDPIAGVNIEASKTYNYAKENWNNPDAQLNFATMAWGVFGGSLVGTNINVSKGFTLANSSEEMITLYRGVNSESPAFSLSSKGIVKPRGGFCGHTNTTLHNTGLNGTAKSSLTSWTTDIDVALNFAFRQNGEGVLLTLRVPKSRTITSPNLKQVNLIHKLGTIVSESEVFLKGTQRALKAKKVSLSNIGN